MPQLSVIIPVYKADLFLEEMSTKLCSQTAADVEYLFIDNSQNIEINNKIQQLITNIEDKRFKVAISQSGVSHARNKGLEIASGDYILFIDVDDDIQPDFIERYYNRIIQKQTDLEFFAYKWCNAQGNVIKESSFKKELLADDVDGEKLIRLIGQQQLFGYLWSFISKRSLWKSVKFNTDLSILEDLDVLVKLASKNSLKAGFNNEAHYSYVRHAKSSLQQMPIEECVQYHHVALSLLNTLNENKVSRKSAQILRNEVLNLYMSLAKLAAISNNSISYKIAQREFVSNLRQTQFESGKVAIKRFTQAVILMCKLKIVLIHL